MGNNLARRDPFDILFEPLGRALVGFGPLADMDAAPAMRIDVRDDNGVFRVDAEIPGARRDDIDVSVEGDRVSLRVSSKSENEEKSGGRVIRREIRRGASERVFSLGVELDPERAEAKYEDGILRLTLPRKAAGNGTRRLAVS